MLNGWEIGAIVVVVMILFGAKKIPQMFKGLAEGIREFRKVGNEAEEEARRLSERPEPKRDHDVTV